MRDCHEWLDEMLEHSCNTCGRMEGYGERFGDGPDGLLECSKCRETRLELEELESETYERMPS